MSILQVAGMVFIFNTLFVNLRYIHRLRIGVSESAFVNTGLNLVGKENSGLNLVGKKKKRDGDAK